MHTLSHLIREREAVWQVLQTSQEHIQLRATLYAETLRQGGRLYWAGNGGSAAICQHIAAEYVGRFQRERAGWPAVALTTDTSILTAVGNDYGFEMVFARQVEAQCRLQDLLILHSTSGNSANIVVAAQVAIEKNIPVVAMVGQTPGRLGHYVDDCFVVQADSTAVVQEVHLAVEHCICALVEAKLCAAE